MPTASSHEQGFFEPERKEFHLTTMADYFQHIQTLRTRINAYKGRAVKLNWNEENILQDAERALMPTGATQDQLLNICAASLLSQDAFKDYQKFATLELSPPLDDEQPSEEHARFMDINVKVINAFWNMHKTGIVPQELNQPLTPELQTLLRNQLKNVDVILRQL